MSRTLVGRSRVRSARPRAAKVCSVTDVPVPPLHSFGAYLATCSPVHEPCMPCSWLCLWRSKGFEALTDLCT